MRESEKIILLAKIEQLVKSEPNDMELGGKIRALFGFHK